MTTPLKASPIRLTFDPAEIFAQKTQVVIKIKQIMLERKISNVEASQMLTLSENDFKELIGGEYNNYPLAYLKTLHKRILSGEA